MHGIGTQKKNKCIFDVLQLLATDGFQVNALRKKGKEMLEVEKRRQAASSSGVKINRACWGSESL